MDGIRASKVLDTLGLDQSKHILLSAHRDENIDLDESFFSLVNAVNGLAETYSMPVIYSTHPRSRKMIERRGFKLHPNVRSLEPFGLLDYNKL